MTGNKELALKKRKFTLDFEERSLWKYNLMTP